MRLREFVFMGLLFVLVGLLVFPTMVHDSVTAVGGISGFPNGFEAGDLLFMDCKAGQFPAKYYMIGDSNDHVAIYMGDTFTYDSVTGGWFAHTSDPVEYRHYTSFCDNFTNFEFWQVNVSSGDKSDAVDVAEDIVSRGDGYQTSGHEKSVYVSGPTQQSWFCSEFVWACYYAVGVDIDQNGFTDDYPPGLNSYATVWMGWPLWYHDNDIKEDSDVEEL